MLYSPRFNHPHARSRGSYYCARTQHVPREAFGLDIDCRVSPIRWAEVTHSYVQERTDNPEPQGMLLHGKTA